MAKEDFILRETVNAPLTTKGSALTWANVDANFIELYNQLVNLSQSSNVDAYDNSVKYDDTYNNYVMYNNQLWKFINETPTTDQTPVEGFFWTAVYATDLVGKSLGNYKEYRASLTQSGTSAPSIIDETGKDTSCGTITGAVHARTDVGTFTITKTGAFGSGTSVVLGSFNGYISLDSITDDVITYRTFNFTEGIATDGLLKNTGIIITVKN